MTINITDDSDNAIDLEQLVIKIFDGIKCAAATENQFRLYLNKYEVKYFADKLNHVTNIEVS